MERQLYEQVELIRRISRGETLYHKRAYGRMGEDIGSFFFIVNSKREMVPGRLVADVRRRGYIVELPDKPHAVTPAGKKTLAKRHRSIRNWPYSPED